MAFGGARVFRVELADVTSEMRRSAKAVNFGIIYGQSPFGLAKSLDIDVEEAAVFIDSYFERFARVAEYIEEIKETTKKSGYAETLLGRRRYIPEIKSANFQVRAAAERVARALSSSRPRASWFSVRSGFVA